MGPPPPTKTRTTTAMPMAVITTPTQMGVRTTTPDLAGMGKRRTLHLPGIRLLNRAVAADNRPVLARVNEYFLPQPKLI